MISRVRLQRKFNSKSKSNFLQQVMLIFRIQIVFQLLIILLTCLFNLSLDFHFDHIFVCQFWSTTEVFHYNLGMLTSCVLFCPYLVYVQRAKVNLVKDCYFTVLLIHSLFGLLRTLQIELGYLLFIIAVGYLTSTATQYYAMVLEQKKLIEEINFIQSEDRKQTQFEDSQFSSLTTFEMSDSL